MLTLIIILIAILSNLLLALFVLLNNPKNRTNLLFFLVTVSMLAFAVVNYISLNPFLFSQLTWIRLDLLSAVFLFLFVFLTFAVFPNPRFTKSYRKTRYLFSLYSVAIAGLVLTPHVFSHLDYSGENPSPVPGPAIGLFAAQQILAIVLSAVLIKHKLNQATLLQRKQLSSIVLGTVLTLLIIIGFNLIAVQVFDIFTLIPLSTFATFIFTSSFFYAVIRRRFLNIRLLVARSIAYIMSLSALGLIYSFIIFVLSLTFLKGLNIEFEQQIIYFLLAAFLVYSFRSLRGYFDRITDRLFYRDAYDPQAFLDELNKTIVGNIELGILLRHTTAVIEKNIKLSHCYINVLETPKRASRLIGVGDMSLAGEQYEYIFDKLSESDKNIIASDDLSYEDGKTKRILLENNVGIVVRLVPDKNNNQAIAHLILGSKKSGNIYTKQDIRIIGIIADQLLIAIQNSLRFEEIQGFAVTLQQKVNEATAKLKKTNEKLKALDQTKDEFISMASHQLRTPLTSVKGYMSMVLEGDAGELKKPQRELLSQAFISSQQMVYLIADLLNVSRLKSGKFILDTHPTNLADVVESEISQLTETAKSKGLELSYDKPKKFPDLMLDETKTRQVIMNFADNAIYYSRTGGKINIVLRQDTRNIYFSVKDNGMGVPKEEKSKLFTKFYRASNARQARPDGTGLGLFMAKKVIDSQGGNIIFETLEGKGSTFGFTFNKKKLSVKS